MRVTAERAQSENIAFERHSVKQRTLLVTDSNTREILYSKQNNPTRVEMYFRKENRRGEKLMRRKQTKHVVALERSEGALNFMHDDAKRGLNN